MVDRVEDEVEWERRFLFREVPAWVPEAATPIAQGYSYLRDGSPLAVCAGSTGTEVKVETARWMRIGPDWIDSWLSRDGGAYRVRRRGDHFYFAVKRPSRHKNVPLEWEREIPVAVFEVLWPETAQERVVKLRSLTAANEDPGIVELLADGVWLSPDLFVEWDRFQGNLDCVVIAEIEFDSRLSYHSFRIPAAWQKLGPVEVSDDARFTNRLLSRLTRDGARSLVDEKLASAR